jgi:hypothetical protein
LTNLYVKHQKIKIVIVPNANIDHIMKKIKLKKRTKNQNPYNYIYTSRNMTTISGFMLIRIDIRLYANWFSGYNEFL